MNYIKGDKYTHYAIILLPANLPFQQAISCATEHQLRGKKKQKTKDQRSS
jgi:hypothetical protein